MEQSIAREDPGEVEKKIDSEESSVLNSQTQGKIEDAGGRLWLSEDETLLRARNNPGNEEPIYVTFGPGDRDNPRNWGKARKWYITCFVSFLNVITCDLLLTLEPFNLC